MISKPWCALLAAMVLSAVVTVHCTPGAIGAAARPSDPTAWEATGDSSGTCRVVSDFGEPLIVDWEAHQRGNLEEAMNDGVAVVAYDCHSLRLLRGCRIDGTYGFMAFSRKQENVRLENADEVGANLPAFGISLLQGLRGDLTRDSTLDLSMILVGKKRTTLRGATVDRLQGGAACSGATHFVRGAFVGAFALGTGTKGAAALGVDLFKASSSSSKLSRYRDGEPDSCEQVKPDAAAPPDSCDALLRLELVALGTRVDSGDTEPPPQVCAQGLVLSAGKCARATEAAPHRCDPEDVADCTTQCARREASSCTSLASMFRRGKGVAKDEARAASLYAQACDGDDSRGCDALGILYARGMGVAKDEARGAALMQKACDLGNASGCANLGVMFGSGTGVAKDAARAFALLQQSCGGGNAAACGNLGVLYDDGAGVAKDERRASALFKQACDGGDAHGCASLGAMYETGSGVAVDRATAVRLYRAGCQSGNDWGCEQLTRLGESR